MEKFDLPKLFEDKLEEITSFSGLVKTSLSEFRPWLERNNLKFFTEYTGHGLEHVEEILREADDLIPEICRDNNFSAADAAVLILATLLHDCAMHINVDGFLELVEDEDRPVIPGFGDIAWKVLWLDFLAEARRFSGRKLIALFGTPEPIQHPPMDSQKMTERDLLLIGEFLRRHHHRLAHEIALWGVPGPMPEKLKIKPMDDVKFIVELAGIVARSHGMNLRDCADYLKISYGSEKIYKGVHVAFVMALLRIADILQIHSGRAPEQIEKVQKLRSPVSLSEWDMHQAIEFINKSYTDPETIFVVAQPKTVSTYLRIRELLDNIQMELDQAWTILGETYAYMPQFRGIGLKYRRIKCNIDNLETFAKQVDYIPTQASFEVADTDLLKLLIGPLYGEQAAIGIRELMQNSLDAVNELQEYMKQDSKYYLDFVTQEAEVVISINKKENNEWWLTISDKGIGMTLNTVKEYFLKAGASLRRSEIWKKTFENEDGNSKILRSGRFGIGALAAFLIGDEIKVSTRHISCPAEEGIEFSSQLDTVAIEMKNLSRPIGTTIAIKMNENAVESIIPLADDNEQVIKTKQENWDWFCLNEPKITRKINQEEINQSHYLPTLSSDIPLGWHQIEHEHYKEIHWSYLPNYPIACNGIIIKNATDSLNYLRDENLSFQIPALSIFDFDAKFPLNIQRTAITTSSLPFQDELLKGILRDFMAYLLVEAPTKRDQYNMMKYYGIANQGLIPFWASTNKGIFPIFETSIFNTMNKRSCLAVFGERRNLHFPEALLSSEEIILSIASGAAYDSSFEGINKSIANAFGFSMLKIPSSKIGIATQIDFYGRKMKAKRLLINKKLVNGLLEYKKYSNNFVLFNEEGFESPFLVDDLSEILNELIATNFGESKISEKLISQPKVKAEIEWENENWIVLSEGEQQKFGFDFENLVTLNSINENSIIAEWFFEREVENKKSYFSQLWEELQLTPIIPYNLDERRKILAYVYEELKFDIENYIATRELIKKKENLEESFD